MVVATGGGKLGEITFEDIKSVLAKNKNLRRAVVRLLAQQHSADLLSVVKIVSKVAAPTRSAKAKKR